jgi:hypothetical protein
MPNRILSLFPFIEDQKWTTNSAHVNGRIRNEKGQCPICAIIDVLSDGKIVYTADAFSAWQHYFVDGFGPAEWSEVVDIMWAADSTASEWRALRKQLLKLVRNAE